MNIYPEYGINTEFVSTLLEQHVIINISTMILSIGFVMPFTEQLSAHKKTQSWFASILRSYLCPTSGL